MCMQSCRSNIGSPGVLRTCTAGNVGVHVPQHCLLTRSHERVHSAFFSRMHIARQPTESLSLSRLQPHVAQHIHCATARASTPASPIEHSPDSCSSRSRSSRSLLSPEHFMPACTRSAQLGLMQLVPLQRGRSNGQPPSQEPFAGSSLSTRYFMKTLPYDAEKVL